MDFELTPKERIKGIMFPSKINRDLAYLCGVLAGDGSIRFQQEKNHYQIKCVGNPKDEKEFYNNTIRNLVKKLFNLEVMPKYHDSKTTFGISISSKNLVKYLTEVIGLPLGKKYDKLSIPKIFLRSNKLVCSFISGVADTDFHIQIRKKYYPVIKGTSKSE